MNFDDVLPSFIAEASELLRKPYRREQLIDAIRRLLDNA